MKRGGANNKSAVLENYGVNMKTGGVNSYVKGPILHNCGGENVKQVGAISKKRKYWAAVNKVSTSNFVRASKLIQIIK